MNHYEALGVTSDADAEQIKAAFRQIAKDCHPDRNPDPKAHAAMKAASAAWAVLKDASTRAAYDAELAAESRPKRRKSADPAPKPCVTCGEPSFKMSNRCWRCLLREAAHEAAKSAEEAQKKRVEEEAKRRDEQARARAEAMRRRREDLKIQASLREQALNDQQRDAEGTTNMHGYDDPIHAPDADALFEAILSDSALRAAKGVQQNGVNVWLHITPNMRLEPKGDTVDLVREVHKGLRQANRLMTRVSKWFSGS